MTRAAPPQAACIQCTAMKTPLLFQCCLGLALAMPALARAAEPPTAPEAKSPAEPRVQHTVTEDDGSRIEELKVRGETQRLTVTTKGPLHSSYEILTVRNGSTRGNAGQRVWSVLAF